MASVKYERMMEESDGLYAGSKAELYGPQVSTFVMIKLSSSYPEEVNYLKYH